MVGIESGMRLLVIVGAATFMHIATTQPAEDNRTAVSTKTISSAQSSVVVIPLEPAQPTSVGPDKVEVIEIFSYGCPHCYALETHVESWDKRKARYVEFIRIPVPWNYNQRAYAKIYYVLQALGRLDLHRVVFDAIHRNPELLAAKDDDAQTLKLQLAFAKAHGIDEGRYREAYESSAVTENLRRANELVLRYKVDGVPFIVVNGKYRVAIRSETGQENLFDLVDELVAQEMNDKNRKLNDPDKHLSSQAQ